MREALIKISLIIFGLIIGAAIGEVILRIAHREQTALTLYHYYKNDPVSGYDIAENVPPQKNGVDDVTFDVWSNNIGCLDIPYNGEPVNALLVGDSFTWGFAPFEQKWGTLLEKELGGRRVLKCGVGGYGTKQELLKAEKVLDAVKQNPKLIVVGYFTNDLGDDYVFPQSVVMNGALAGKRFLNDIETGAIGENSRETLERRMAAEGTCEIDYNVPPIIKKTLCLLNQLELYKTFKDPLKTLLLKTVGRGGASTFVSPEHKSFWQRGALEYLSETRYPWLAAAWKSHLENIKAFKALAGKHEARLLFVVIPSKEDVYTFLPVNPSPFSPPGIDSARPYKVLDAFFEKEHIDHLDLLPLMKPYADETPRKALGPADLYYSRDGHLNNNGNFLAGLLVGKFVLERDYIAVPKEEKTKTLQTIQSELQKLPKPH